MTSKIITSIVGAGGCTTSDAVLVCSKISSLTHTLSLMPAVVAGAVTTLVSSFNIDDIC